MPYYCRFPSKAEWAFLFPLHTPNYIYFNAYIMAMVSLPFSSLNVVLHHLTTVPFFFQNGAEYPTPLEQRNLNMVQYKLYYFDVPGLAEPIRMLFNYVGQSFEDIRFQREQWPNEKPKFFYGTVPVLDIDGKQLAQSTTILRFLGEKFGLAGKDEWEKAKTSEYVDFLKDVGNDLGAYVIVKRGFREGDVEKLRKEVFEPGVKRYFPLIVKLLGQSSSGFLLSSGLTFVDFSFADFLKNVGSVEPGVLKSYPELEAFVQKVHSLPQLKDYMANRKYYQ